MSGCREPLHRSGVRRVDGSAQLATLGRAPRFVEQTLHVFVAAGRSRRGLAGRWLQAAALFDLVFVGLAREANAQERGHHRHHQRTDQDPEQSLGQRADPRCDVHAAAARLVIGIRLDRDAALLLQRRTALMLGLIE